MVAFIAVPPTASAAPRSPAVGDCLAIEDPASAWSPSKVVDCAELHDSEVYDIVAYPANAGAPSTLSDNEVWAVSDECSYAARWAWLGAEPELPLSLWFWPVTLPTDDQWASGSREVLCRVVRPDASGGAMQYRGSIPRSFAAGPLLPWLYCANGTPKSGADNPQGPCSKKSKWLNVGGQRVKGKVTSNYPRDLQRVADKKCAKLAKEYGKRGTKARAALLDKELIDPGWIFTECFIPVTRWNGKVK